MTLGLGVKIESVSDDYEEVFTVIRGSCHSKVINKLGILRNVELYSGASQTNMNIKGRRRNITGIGLERFYERNVYYIHAPRFLGFIHEISTLPPRYSILGFAFGDIGWKN